MVQSPQLHKTTEVGGDLRDDVAAQARLSSTEVLAFHPDHFVRWNGGVLEFRFNV